MAGRSKFKCVAIMMILCLFCVSVGFAAPADQFLGRWALELPGGAGWLKVRQESGYLDADLLWYGGSVVPVNNVYVDGDMLVVEMNWNQIRKKDDQGKTVRVHTMTRRIELKPTSKTQLAGVAKTPRGDSQGVDKMEFKATRIPPLGKAPDLKQLKFGAPIKLFNGKDLTGWKLTSSGATSGWSVLDGGVLMNNPVQIEGQPHKNYGNLRTSREFEDFNLKLEVNVPGGSNSGVYLKGIYEVQVVDSYGKGLDSHNMGALYSRITPSQSAEKPAGQWQSLNITLCDRYLTVILNGKTIIDNQPVYGVTGGALTSNEFKPGPIYLQGDHGKVLYRNIVLTPIVK